MHIVYRTRIDEPFSLNPGWYAARWDGIENAPKDRTVDLWAKRMDPKTGTFVYGRFPNCIWSDGLSRGIEGGLWVGLDPNWFATHWIEPPPGPADDTGRA